MKKLVDAFIARVGREGLPVEAVIAYQDDRLAAEHHWVADAPRNIYSHTKSFTSTAAGIAIADGLLSLDDTVGSFLADSLPAGAGPDVAGLTLRSLLMMASGFHQSLLMMSNRGEAIVGADYARFVLSHPLVNTPGSTFCYSNGDTYLAGRMVEASVGQTLRSFLQARLFEPMEIVAGEWEHCPLGHTFGASGLCLRIADMAKLGRLYANGGRWNGRQLVSPGWIAEATACHIATPGDESPWHVGYGYQFWRSPYPKAYRADGAFGQTTTVLPEARAVVSTQCTESDRFPAIRAALDEEVFSRL